jgi:hypothetical protein
MAKVVSTITKPHFVAAKRIVAYLMIYNFFIWFVFSLIYRYIDFKKHFVVPDTYKRTWDESVYFSFQVQSLTYATSNVPKTQTGRSLVAIQGCLAWLQTIIFLAPWIAVRRPFKI